MHRTRPTGQDGAQLDPYGPALSLRGISKRFGRSQALDDVALEIRHGEIHALVGQNGSGKSTLVKILAGFHQPDAGTAFASGQRITLGDPEAATKHNIRFVHQDLGLVDSLNAIENVALGAGYDTSFGRIVWRRETEAVGASLRSLGYTFDVRRPVGELTPSERVGVAVARALRGWHHSGESGLLVLDEPTASMPAPEVARLFEVIQAVRDSGTPVLYVSHRFEEIFRLADRATILRDGRVVATRPMDELDHDGLVELLLGRRLSLEHYDSVVKDRAQPVIEAIGIGGEILEHLDLAVPRGEVLGVAGVTGSGREELAKLLFGVAKLRCGSLRIEGKTVTSFTPSEAIAHGIGLVPGDRHHQGIVPGRVRENMTLVDLAEFWSAGRLRRREEVKEVNSWIRRLSLTPADPEAPIESLSGGNQQKVMVAKWLRVKPRVLVLEEPTQGVDVGSKADIHHLLRDAAASGVSVIVVSTDLEELVHLCDRVVVIVGGRGAAELAGDGLTSERLAEAVLASSTRTGAR